MIGLVAAIRQCKLSVIVLFTAEHIKWDGSCEIPGWFEAAHRRLEPLNAEQLGRILDGLLRVHTDLRDELIDYADGNPERLLEGVHAARRGGRVLPCGLMVGAPEGWEPIDEEDDEEA